MKNFRLYIIGCLGLAFVSVAQAELGNHPRAPLRLSQSIESDADTSLSSDLVEEKQGDADLVLKEAEPESAGETVSQEAVSIDEKVSIGKIFDFLNDPSRTPVADNEAMRFEMKFRNHGAYNEEMKAERKGHYYVVNWSNDGPERDLVLRMEYRQRKSQDQVHTLEIPYNAVRGSQKATFFITGDAYKKLGPVTTWRVTLVADGKIVAEKRSFVW